MRELCDGGMAASEAAKVVLATHPEIFVAASADPQAEAKQRILRAAERLDSEALDAELVQLGYASDALTLYERVVSPLLSDVGNLWLSGSMSIAQEHFLSGRIEVMLRNALAAVRPRQGPDVLLACITGEHHVIGLLGAALQLSGWGARPILLGADTPPEAVADAVQLRRPALVGLSLTRTPARPKSLFAAYAAAMDGVPWIVGGDAADEIEPVVVAAGGLLASPRATSWHREVSERLRKSERLPRTRLKEDKS